jgi:aminomethyltransferase
LGAKFAEFGGWKMPLEYVGVLTEHRAVREAVGVFDVSHLGTVIIEGTGAAQWLNTRLSNDLDRIGTGQGQYTLLLNDEGGVIDDMIAYQRDPDWVMVMPNAANTATVINRLRRDQSAAGLRFTLAETAIIAVQGPASATVLDRLDLPTDIDYMSFRFAEYAGVGEVMVCRSGYTGELGYELILNGRMASTIWAALMVSGESEGIQPCGLGARDTLRTEMGYPLHGQDLSETISALEARLSWAVGWKKDRFDGAEALRAQRASGVVRTLLGLRALGRAIPRPGMKVLDNTGNEIGEVTSGTFSPTLRQGIGLALLATGIGPGETVQVDLRGRMEAFEVTKPPFYTPRV